MPARFTLSMTALLTCGSVAFADGQIRERIRDQWQKRQAHVENQSRDGI